MIKRESCPTRLVRTGLVLFVTAGLWGSGSAPAAEASPPTITSFNISPVTEGDKGAERSWVELSWATEGADEVRLYRDERELGGRHQLASGEIGWPVSMKGGLKTQLKRPAAFKLVASNADGQVSKLVEVEAAARPEAAPSDGPQILSFEATPRTIQPGGTVRFSWETRNAELVRLYDDHGELESRIVLPSGKLGWPPSMNGALQESPGKTTTYQLVAISKTGKTSKSLDVTVEGAVVAEEEGQEATKKDCRVIVSIRGKYGQFTDAVGVFRGSGAGTGEFVFKSPVTTAHDRRAGADASAYQRSRLTVPPGVYRLVPSGGGEDDAGPFGVIYEPRRSTFTCADGHSGNFSFQADFAEY